MLRAMVGVLDAAVELLAVTAAGLAGAAAAEFPDGAVAFTAEVVGDAVEDDVRADVLSEIRVAREPGSGTASGAGST